MPAWTTLHKNAEVAIEGCNAGILAVQLEPVGDLESVSFSQLALYHAA